MPMERFWRRREAARYARSTWLVEADFPATSVAVPTPERRRYVVGAPAQRHRRSRSGGSRSSTERSWIGEGRVGNLRKHSCVGLNRASDAVRALVPFRLTILELCRTVLTGSAATQEAPMRCDSVRAVNTTRRAAVMLRTDGVPHCDAHQERCLHGIAQPSARAGH